MATYLKKIREENNNLGSNKKEVLRGTGHVYDYKPSKLERKKRAHIMDRYRRMRDDPLRKEAEEDWDRGDKFYRLWRPKRDADDWRADIRLPDAFASIQTHLQETIGMKIRPGLKPHEGSDTALAFWANSIMSYNLDRTSFDLETIRAFLCSATKGTAFTVEMQLFETRKVKDPDSVENGIIKYIEREIIDKDDTFTMHWPNERTFVDEAADVIEKAEDCILEERLRWDTFKMKYGDSDRYKNIDKVIPNGSLSDRTQFFDRSDDDPMDGDYVQCLHYYNKYTDTYAILANTVIITDCYDDPIPFKHKELPISVWNYYPVEGRLYGMGIPKIIAPTQEEREAIRNLSVDRQKMHLHKMFIVSDLFDIDEDEATTRPHGFIHVNSGGMPLDNVIKPIEYGDVPGSSIRMDDQLRDDEKRVTGIDDRSQGVNMGGTATEAAILTEQSQKRINLINTMTAMSTMDRIGKLKWSNIQFFYPAPRIENITEGNEDKEKKVYRKINVDGMKFTIVKNEGTGKNELSMNEITGTASFKLDAAHARFFDGDFDISVAWDIKALTPQAIRSAKTMETFMNFTSNPMTMQQMNLRGAMKDVLMEADFDPKTWLTEKGMDDEDQMMKAQFENQIMMYGQPLDPTSGASEQHTMQHLWFTETDYYKKAVEANPAIGMIFQRHILGENENGPGGGTAGGTEPNPGAGMSGVPEMGGAPPPGENGPIPPPPPEVAAALAAMNGGGNSAAPDQANPAGPVANGGAVTNEMAPLR